MKTQLTIYALLISFFSFAQVGINTDTPNQALDVNGKIKIGNDGTAPTEGTVRYSSNGDFEGYRANGWESFTNNRNGNLPSNPVPITSFINNISPSSSVFCTIYDWSGSSFINVPTGKKVIITGIYPSPNSASISNLFYALSLSAYTSSDSIIIYSRIRLSSYDNETRYISGDQAPLIVLNEGDKLNVFNYGSSELGMSVSIRGFMVDDLNY